MSLSSPVMKSAAHQQQARIQWRFVCKMVGIALLGFGLLYLGNLAYLATLMEEGRAMGLHSSHIYFDFVDRQRQLMQGTIGVVALVTLVGIGVFAYLLSRRFFATFRRLERQLELLAAGEAASVELDESMIALFPGGANAIAQLARQQGVQCQLLSADGTTEASRLTLVPATGSTS